MSNKLPETEKYFVWKQLIKDENDPSQERLITPCGDPMIYEFPMDLLFDSEQLAHNALVDYDLLEQAIEEKWFLCVQEITPISLVIETLIPKE